MKQALITYLLILLLCLVGSSCRKSLNVASILMEADSLMYTRPDSALTLLETIPTPERLTGKARADYALLLTQACSRNLITATSDSLIRIAVDFYQNSDEKEQKAKSLLYWGDVYLDMGKYAEAALPLKQAEELMDGVKDPYIKYLVRSNLGYLNRKGKNYKLALAYYKIALPFPGLYEYTRWRTSDSGTAIKLSSSELADSIRACLHQLQQTTKVDLFTNHEAKQIQTALQEYDKTIVSREKAEIEIWLHRILLTFILLITVTSAIIWFQKKKSKKHLQELQEQIAKITSSTEADKTEIALLNEMLVQHKFIRQEYNHMLQFATKADIDALIVYLRLLQSPETYNPQTDIASLQHWLNLTQNNFVSRLKETYPNLTLAELNLCCLQRIGYSPKQMSQALRVKEDTVRRNVYRVCTHLNLENDKAQFANFIQHF